MSETLQRELALQEAREWIGTPYHHMGRVKGAQGGVDCAMLLLEVYEKAGVIEHVVPDYYPPDWMLHRSEERYLIECLNHGHEIEQPLPGDVVVVKFGRCFAHGAIVVQWPVCIHAYLGAPVSYVNALLEAIFKKETGELRDMKFISPWNS